MRQRVLVGTKLLEVVSRGFFVVICTYQLPLVEAGRFGFAATIIGLAAFVLGYERHIDVQRQLAGRSPRCHPAAVFGNFTFFRFHYAWAMPALALLLGVSTHWPLVTIGCVLCIVAAEHLTNQSYHAALVDRRAFPLLLSAAIKNLLQLSAIAWGAWQMPASIDADWVLIVWVTISFAYLLTVSYSWRSRYYPPSRGDDETLQMQDVSDQYRASTLHFLVGVVAVIALQADRLVVGGALSPHEVGVYFRNITLSALAFQIFNIVSFNRVALVVYKHSKDGRSDLAKSAVRKEHFLFSGLLALGVGAGLLINGFLGDPAAMLELKASYILCVTFIVIFRTAADYAGLLLISAGRDRELCINQAVAVLIGVACLLFLAVRQGLFGAFFGATVTPLVYWILNYRSVSFGLKNRIDV